jgi:tripartite-type tricarboxylate transporter receptor subunit TctC
VGLFALKDTPPQVVSTLTSAVDKAANSEPYKGALEKLGLEGGYLGAQAFKTFWDGDAKRVEEAVTAIGKVQG